LPQPLVDIQVPILPVLVVVGLRVQAVQLLRRVPLEPLVIRCYQVQAAAVVVQGRQVPLPELLAERVDFPVVVAEAVELRGNRLALQEQVGLEVTVWLSLCAGNGAFSNRLYDVWSTGVSSGFTKPPYFGPVDFL
jgi:hypothetical protein